MNRPTTSLLATVAALAAVAGLASFTSGADGGSEGGAGESRELPVQRTTLTCPRPSSATASATTAYTAFTPPLEGGDEEAGAASLLPAPEYAPGGDAEDGEGDDAADGEDAPDGDGGAGPEPTVPLEEPGTPVADTTRREDAPALAGSAEDRLAPGWTVQQTTVVRSGGGRGMLGTACQQPDTAFWFAGASTADGRRDYVHLTNPDEAATVVDIELYGPDGPLESSAADGVTVPGQSSVPVLLSTLTDEPVGDLALRAAARTGRVGAQVETIDQQRGADWLAPTSALPGEPLVLPGIPGDAEAVRLVALAPGDEDVTLDVALAGPTGTITPAGNETVSLKSGQLTAVDLGALTQGEAGSLVLTPARGSGDGAVVATAHVIRGEDDEREMAFIPATGPIEERATVAGSSAEDTELSLVAPEEAVEVEVTYSAGTDGGEAVTETYTVDGETTLAVAGSDLPHEAEGRFAVTVERLGDGPLYASRRLTSEHDGVSMFTIQTLPDDGSRVHVPETGQDVSILTN